MSFFNLFQSHTPRRGVLATLLALTAMLVGAPFASAQSQDGTINAGEYGTHSDGQNRQTAGTGTWYMSWDATNLYIALAGPNTAEGAILYLDKNPIAPLNGGANSDGTLVGFDYDGSSFAALPFRADLVVYFKDGYREYRTADGANGWSSQTSGFGSYGSASGNREIAIPWSAIGGQPSAFNWFGYVAYSGGGAYASMPPENPGAGGGTTIGNSARWARYYTVSSSSTAPFSRNSYVFTGASDESGFGAISVYDFTMNSSGRSLTRGSGAWTISGDLRVDAGTVNFGSVSNGAAVSGNVVIGSSGTLTLSSASGGDLALAGNWTRNGTFNPSGRTVTFDGSTSQTLSGSTTFDGLTLANSAGLSLSADATVNGVATLGAHRITTGANKLSLGASASISRTSGYVVGNLERAVSSGAGVSRSFDIGDASNYTPVHVTFGSVSNGTGLLTASVNGSAGSPAAGSNLSATKYVNRAWTLSNNGVSFDDYSATFDFVAGDVQGGANTSALAVAKNSGGTWSLPSVGTRTGTSTQATGLTAFSDFHLGELANFTITASAGAGGSISPSGAQTVNNGDSLAFTITPDAGYSIADVLVDGVSVGAVGSYTFSNVTAGHTIAASFSLNSYTIAASASAGGSISPSGNQSVSHGDSLAFTITPDAGYSIADVLV
ncbi:MAG: hypothetical protein RL721_2308, partial [Candidatus Eisenbacteria bacterium]